MKENGFTLVELMIVIVVIGVLATVAMPKFQTAAGKAKAAEAPQVLIAIAGAQEAYRILKGEYLDLDNSTNLDNWQMLGIRVPQERYFRYVATAATGTPGDPNDQLDFGTPPEFLATATLIRSIASAKADDIITIDHKNKRDASDGLKPLIPTFLNSGTTP
jgi:prepilin-type N-terminal cleavage/methylation domain-containing protein